MIDMIFDTLEVSKNGETVEMHGVADGEKNWEVIFETTLTEETSVLKVNLDKNGNPFELKKAKLLIMSETASTSANALIYLGCDDYNVYPENNEKAIYFFADTIIATTNRLSCFKAYNENGEWYLGRQIASTNFNSNNSVVIASPYETVPSILTKFYSPLRIPDAKIYKTIKNLNIYIYGSSLKMPVGTKIALVGIRA